VKVRPVLTVLAGFRPAEPFHADMSGPRQGMVVGDCCAPFRVSLRRGQSSKIPYREQGRANKCFSVMLQPALNDPGEGSCEMRSRALGTPIRSR